MQKIVKIAIFFLVFALMVLVGVLLESYQLLGEKGSLDTGEFNHIVLKSASISLVVLAVIVIMGRKRISKS